MNTVMDPLLAILGIVVPLGLAYLIVVMQAFQQKDETGNDRNREEP